MATLNTCKKCGCQDAFLTTPPPCPTPAGCPNPEPCSEVTFAECVIYTGTDILCNEDIVVATDTNLADALNDVSNYFCNNVKLINGYISILQNNQGLFATAFRGSLNPTINVNTVTANLANSNIANGITIIMPIGDIEYQVTDSLPGSQYNTSTGVWTCPQTGAYDINYNVYLTCPDQTGFGWGNTPTTTGGAYTIGVTNPGVTGTSVYCASTFTVTKGVYATRIYLTGGLQGKIITAGTQIVLRHQNMTGINYTGISGDNIDWSVRRVG